MTRSHECGGVDERNPAEHPQAEAGVDEEPIPVPEHGAPYSDDFLAHRRGGMYEDLPDHTELWRGVRADTDATRVIAALDAVTAQLQVLTPELSPWPERHGPVSGLRCMPHQ